ncbi:DUF2066 domain-containing protein [Candidatus Pelagibacter communis]|uniref:DUF2066 domain-containing protein n=1 Tax=Pelagibacter ubique TaxID=198252 RepID=UPI00094BF284|nr:DUF2066 domain-containing protein [Candidatus Pelagibacter ubique]
MSYYKISFIILIIFLKTGNVLSLENIFNVNNIEIAKKSNNSNDDLANKAIKKGFEELLEKILLDKDIKKISELEFSKIKELVSYYQIANETKNSDKEKVNFNIFFDKDKLHSLFSNKSISYSDISDKELYLLPVILKKNEIIIYNNNYFYDYWNKIYQSELIEFILPIENIEVIQNISVNKENLYGIDLQILFKEYENKNLALVLIEDIGSNEKKIYLRTKIINKKIDKTIKIKKGANTEKFNDEIIKVISKELINVIKSQNLIDVRTPSFLNARLITNKKNNLVELNNRLQNLDTVDGIFVQEFNNKYVLLKIRYLGKLDKIINQLKQQNIMLEFTNDQWNLKIKK